MYSRGIPQNRGGKNFSGTKPRAKSSRRRRPVGRPKGSVTSNRTERIQQRVSVEVKKKYDDLCARYNNEGVESVLVYLIEREAARLKKAGLI